MIDDNYVCAAINGKRLLQFRYEYGLRVVEPHLLGYDTDGDLTLSAWQLSGESGQGWRDFHVSRLSGLSIVEGVSRAPRPGYNPNDPTVPRVICGL